MNPKNHTRIITELAACEQKLDTVLFDTGDGAIAATVGGIGLGGSLYAYGRHSRLIKKKQDMGFFKTPVTGAHEVASDIVRGGKLVKKEAVGLSKDLWKTIKNWGGRAASMVR